jgi:four helix bundle protein
MEANAEYAPVRNPPGGSGVLRSYRDLDVWQRAMELAKECYAVAQRLPRTETYGLASQLRRSAVSIPSNIAEGYGRRHRREYLQFTAIANGSLCEVETQLLLAERVGYVTASEIGFAWDLCVETSKMLTALRAGLARAQSAGGHP